VKTYVVGGAVRDELLGLPLKDRDHVVVGATPEEMVRLGFKPVGRDFPVFLHPETHEEYALARTERKSGRGYKGFTVHAAPEVTLEDDLKRRDLTINAMAKAEDGTLIDPFGGRRDLKEGVLRHVSEAFAEDPVRILRVARFAARFGFRVADETMQLMKEMVKSGEAGSLVPERVWQEFSRGLMEGNSALMLAVLVFLATAVLSFGVMAAARVSPWKTRSLVRSRRSTLAREDDSAACTLVPFIVASDTLASSRRVKGPSLALGMTVLLSSRQQRCHPESRGSDPR